MLKLYAILLSSLFLLQSTNIHFDDVRMLGELLEHYNLHHERYGDNFVVFLSKHYGDLKESHKKEHQEEEKGHHHTPIQHDCTAQVHIDVMYNSFSFTFKNPKFSNSSKSNFYYQDKFSSFEKQKIFQPPRV